jgi:predicted O-methyltransferase YrrM
VLAAMRGRLRVAEIGTGAAVRAAWIVSALDPTVPFFTAEADGLAARSAGELFRDDPNVHVLHGDWQETLAAEAPFDLVYLDALAGEQVLGLLAPRGLAVIGAPRGVREFWLGHDELAATELSLPAGEALILAVRSR